MRSSAVCRKIYELRTYKMHPAGFPTYVQLTNEHLHLRTAHSKLSGFWLTEIGGQNEAVHIWEYESLAQRKAVRDALAKDEQWKSLYLANIRGCWAEQQNFGLEPLHHKEKTAPFPFYRLRISKGPNPPPLVSSQPPHRGKAADGSSKQNEDVVVPIASFRISSGMFINQVVQLHASHDIDALTETVESAADAVLSSRIMLNAPWSEKLGCAWK